MRSRNAISGFNPPIHGDSFQINGRLVFVYKDIHRYNLCYSMDKYWKNLCTDMQQYTFSDVYDLMSFLIKNSDI
jgi:hypothetical protein